MMRRLSDKLREAFGHEVQKEDIEDKRTPEQKKKEEEYWKKVYEKQDVKMPNYNEIRDLFFKQYKISYGKEFDSSYNENQLRLILLYFIKDATFTAGNPTFLMSKGLMLVGSYGVGKTSIIRTIKEIGHPLMNFGINSCIKIVEMFNHDDKKVIGRFSSHKEFYFDDFGTEDIGKFNTNVMKSIIEQRYFKSRRNDMLTHVSTNLTFEEITDKYGYRVGSRIMEIFNIIKLDGPDFRTR